ncbi:MULTISPECIES: amidase [unclassified Streptomyces]|uniref:amidase n=1 Tax=unclassified Streptomyces TaxID=2593676 RepID=UPI000F6C4ADA|nr:MULTISPECIES: amidase [unclassified Streptomyces]AZM62274.1 amidase [Streptomyces sp. WAC 01438]RSM96293.1 amidase [Streptomyces sp. WAC 01420]
MTEPHYLSATEILHRYRARTLSPVELVRAVIARAERVEPHVNAFAEEMFEQALRAAAAAEKRYRPGGDPRPLEGLPVAAKEEQPLAGHPVTDGTLLRPARVARETAVGLARIQAAGGILHARTTTSEFCCMPLSHTRRWGVTRNPWNPDASAGGSSGGSAAALAAGTATLATGSDIGGSLRAPASFNGVVGYKPPHGRIPVLPPAGLDPYFHHGPMARTVADTALLHNVMAGPDPRDPASTGRPAVSVPADLAGVRGLRIAVSTAPGDFPVDPEIRTRTAEAAEGLRAAGAVVEEVEIGWRLEDINRALWAHFGQGGAAEILALDRAHPGVITPYTLAFARRGMAAAPTVDPAEGRRLEAAVRKQLAIVLTGFDAFVLPTVGARAFAAGEDYVETDLVVNGVPLAHFADASLTPAFNICSAHPVLSVPSGRASNGVPTGVQIVTAPDAETTAFRIAAAVEQTAGTGFTAGWEPQLPLGGPANTDTAPR